MNIFKVIATSGSTFRERFTSSILAWLLNPTMEHGLGFAFMESFINSIDKEKFSKLSAQLCPYLESNDSIESVNWTCILELNVGIAFIDVVFTIDNWLFAIENKIYSTSASDNQLIREYDGLKKDSRFKDFNICMIYLVPISGDFLDNKINLEFNNLKIEVQDAKYLMTWQPNSLTLPSFSDTLLNIIRAENLCKLEPIHEYTRHTLKAFIQFINNDFQGYESSSHKIRSTTPFEKRHSIRELQSFSIGSVGYNDLNWIINNKEKAKSYQFKYSQEDLSDKVQWLKVSDFNKLIDWIINGNQPYIDWSIWKTISARNIYTITEKYKNVYIGIRGGLKELENLSDELLFSKRWQVSNEKISNEWISGNDYFNTIKKKGIFNK